MVCVAVLVDLVIDMWFLGVEQQHALERLTFASRRSRTFNPTSLGCNPPIMNANWDKEAKIRFKEVRIP